MGLDDDAFTYHSRDPPGKDLVTDGNYLASVVVERNDADAMLSGEYDFSELTEPANVLIFPNLEAGNIGYKLLEHLGDADSIGPMLAGLAEPVHVLQRGDEVKDIVNLASVAVVDAQTRA